MLLNCNFSGLVTYHKKNQLSEVDRNGGGGTRKYFISLKTQVSGDSGRGTGDEGGDGEKHGSKESSKPKNTREQFKMCSHQKLLALIIKTQQSYLIYLPYLS